MTGGDIGKIRKKARITGSCPAVCARKRNPQRHKPGVLESCDKLFLVLFGDQPDAGKVPGFHDMRGGGQQSFVMERHFFPQGVHQRGFTSGAHKSDDPAVFYMHF